MEQTAAASAETQQNFSVMASYEKFPTEQNLITSISTDSLCRNELLQELLYFLDAVDYSCAIALDGQWGSGKTFFVKSAEMCLERMNPFLTNPPENLLNAALRHSFLPVYYDAWANDNENDPLLSLIFAIAAAVEREDYFEEHPTALGVLAATMDAVRGTSMKALHDLRKPEDLLAAVKETRDTEAKIHCFLQECKNELADRIVIFIDELDRCRPTFAVQLLERVKHYFHDDSVTFVLAVNSAELVHTVQAFYGQGFDANRYLDRFFDFRIGLPPADINAYLKHLQYQDEQRMREIYSYEIVSAVAEQYRLSLREVEKLCRALRTIGGSPRNRELYAEDNPAREFCYYVLLPLMYALKMTAAAEFDAFSKGRDVQPLFNLFAYSDATKNYISQFNVHYMTMNNEINLQSAYNALFRYPDYQRHLLDLLNMVNLLSPFASYHV